MLTTVTFIPSHAIAMLTNTNFIGGVLIIKECFTYKPRLDISVFDECVCGVKYINI